MSTRSKRPSTPTTSSRLRTPRKKKTSEDSIDTMCRICMQWDPTAPMVDLFERMVRDVKVAELLGLIGSVQISEDDRLPKLCCARCLKDLERAYKLRMLCQDSDRKLRDLFPDVELAVVKEECADADETNPLEVVCKPDVDKHWEGEVKSEGMEDLVQPELKIEADEVEDCDEVMDDGVADESDEEEDQSDAEESKEKQPKVKVERQLKNENAYEKIPAVGFRCCGCKKVFGTSEELYAHSQAAHADKKQSTLDLREKVQCDICYKVVSNTNILENHQSSSKVNYRCKSCGDLFWSRVRASTHYRRLHGPNPTVSGPSRICCACLERFETEEQLKEHCDAVHLPEKPPSDPNRPFICNICYRNYRTDRHLYSHQTRMVKYGKNHMCSECGKTFRLPSALRDHEIMHSGERVFKCPHCPASYSSRDSYRKHVQEHSTPADKYKCKVCGRCFKKPVGLKEHARIHTGERPFLCPRCPANFARPSCLSAHMLTHTGERNIKCPLCDKRFGRKTEVQKHVKFVHQKLKPFPCFFCQKSYPRKDYRKRHMVSAHPNELRDTPLPEIELSGSTRWHKIQEELIQSQPSSTC